MSVKLLLKYTNFLILAICFVCLAILWRKRSYKDFKMLVLFLATEAMNEAISIPLLFFRKSTGINYALASNIYFYSSWTIFIIQSALIIAIVYSVFHMAMKPLKGLAQMGKLAFRWVSAVAIALSIALGLGPHLATSGYSAMSAWITATTQLQQGISILILCLLLFVCFAIRPLGLTFRSRIFGVSLGLGVYATVQLVSGAWSSMSQTQSVYSPTNLLNAVGALIGYTIWTAYFALPEPERRMILLPTTSPYFFWNAISEALGDAPGHVAVGGVSPAMFASSELDIFNGQASLGSSRAQDIADGFQYLALDAPQIEAPARTRLSGHQLSAIG